jgi:hypothetical protein
MKNHQPKAQGTKNIPPPPGPGATVDELIAYHSQYTLDELERAGYVEDASPQELQGLQASATYHLLRDRGLHLKFTRKECERLSLAAASEAVDVEELVKRWIKQRLRGAAASSRSKTPEPRSSRPPRSG